MLGRYVVKYLLDNNHFVISSTRKDIDAEHDKGSSLTDKILKYKPGVVINCIGLIKQRKNVTTEQMIAVNSTFPFELANACNSISVPLIHITTDCVFDGKLGAYSETSEHTATDTYGKSKSEGEPKNCTVIRTSIVGEEPLGQKLSLLEWVRSQSDKTINGFTNHYWNGVTCLQLAQIIEEIIEEDLYWSGVRHIFSPFMISKCELVRMICDIYRLQITVEHTQTISFCDRTLKSNYNDCASFQIPELWKQIKAMKEFKLL